MEKTHWKKTTNPHYLGSYAFQPGEEKAVTIAAVGEEEVTNPAEPDKKELCTVAHFVQPEKPLILNTTNKKAIARLAESPYIEDWAGVGIILCVQRVPAFGDIVEAVRVRPVKPYTCADCSGIITGYGEKSHAEIRDYTRKQYGRPLCAACATKVRASAVGKNAAPAPEQSKENEQDRNREQTASNHRRRRGQLEA